MAATPQVNTENFFCKMGEKLNNAIDSVGNELNYLVNSQSTQYMQLATGMSNISAGNPFNQNAMKFQQIQNSMPKNNLFFGQMNKEEYAKAGARASTIMMATK